MMTDCRWWLSLLSNSRDMNCQTGTTDSELTRRPPRTRSDSRFPILQM
jgi:hypothetical protein